MRHAGLSGVEYCYTSLSSTNDVGDANDRMQPKSEYLINNPSQSNPFYRK